MNARVHFFARPCIPDPQSTMGHNRNARAPQPLAAGNCHAWCGEKEVGEYAYVPGFCKSTTLDEVRKQGHVFTPGRHLDAEAQEADAERFEGQTKRFDVALRAQQAEVAKLDAAIFASLREIGYGK